MIGRHVLGNGGITVGSGIPAVYSHALQTLINFDRLRVVNDFERFTDQGKGNTVLMAVFA